MLHPLSAGVSLPTVHSDRYPDCEAQDHACRHSSIWLPDTHSSSSNFEATHSVHASFGLAVCRVFHYFHPYIAPESHQPPEDVSHTHSGRPSLRRELVVPAEKSWPKHRRLKDDDANGDDSCLAVQFQMKAFPSTPSLLPSSLHRVGRGRQDPTVNGPHRDLWRGIRTAQQHRPVAHRRVAFLAETENGTAKSHRGIGPVVEYE